MLMFSPADLPFAYIPRPEAGTDTTVGSRDNADSCCWDTSRQPFRSGEDQEGIEPLMWATTQQQMQNHVHRIKWEDDLNDDIQAARDPDSIEDFFFNYDGVPSCYQPACDMDDYYWRPPAQNPRPVAASSAQVPTYDGVDEYTYDMNRFVAASNPQTRGFPQQQPQPQQQQNTARYPPQPQPSARIVSPQQPISRIASYGPPPQQPMPQKRHPCTTPAGDIVPSSFQNPSAAPNLNTNNGNPRIFHTFHPAGAIPLAATTTTTTATTTTVVSIPAAMAVPAPQTRQQTQTQVVVPNQSLALHGATSSSPSPAQQQQHGGEREMAGSPTLRTKGSINKSSSASASSGKKRRNRATPQQLEILEKAFERGMIPNLETRQYLAGQLGFTERRVQVWFQNRRAKLKKLNRRSQVFVLNHGGGDMAGTSRSTLPS